MGCVYKATNKLNGKIYIGMTSNTMEHRRQQHIYASSSNGKKYAFQLAIEKHGKDNFEWEVLFKSDNRQILFKKEDELIKENKSFLQKIGYNLSAGACEEEKKKEK